MRMPYLRALTLVAAVALVPNPATAQENSSAGQHGAVWNLGKLDNGKRYPTTVAAKNENCRGKRTFEIEVSGQIAQFLHITGPTRLENIGRGQVKTTAAVVDLVNAEPGQYEGLISVRCLDCSPACHQDYTTLSVLLEVVGPAAPTMPTGIDTSPPAAVQGPTICPKALDPCAELLAKAQALEDEAATARARARALAEDQDWEDSQARMDEQEASSDEAYAKKLRDQARQWRELADSARQSAATNTRRAGEFPAGSKYNRDWKSEAQSDEATAARRDKHADELDAQADALDKGSKAKRDKAEARRRAAEQAQQDADAKTEAADAARKAYDDCVEKAREACEMRRSQPRPASGGGGTSAGPGPGTGTGTGAGTGTGGSSSTGGGTVPPGPTTTALPPFLPAFKTQPAKISKVCNWVEFELPPGEVVTYVQVRRARVADDQTAIQIERKSGNLERSVSFKYHCDHPGTAMITYRTASNKAYKFRVLCAE